MARSSHCLLVLIRSALRRSQGEVGRGRDVKSPLPRTHAFPPSLRSGYGRGGTTWMSVSVATREAQVQEETDTPQMGSGP
jgi:hypothetical protein